MWGVALVCGGRTYADMSRVFEALDALAAGVELVAIRHGGAAGADELAGMWCRARGVPEQVFRADWRRYGRAAGPLRNGEMLKDGAVVVVVAFPGGAGTADMVRRARAAGLPVVEIEP